MTQKSLFETLDKILGASPKFARPFLNGFDYDHITKWLESGIPAESIMQGVIVCLQNFKPSSRSRSIRKMAYFSGEIYEAEHRRKEREQCTMSLARV